MRIDWNGVGDRLIGPEGVAEAVASAGYVMTASVAVVYPNDLKSLR